MPQEPQEPQPFRLVFVDLETTGLDPRHHEPWEIALIAEDVLPDGSRHVAESDVFLPRPRRLGNADSKALEIGRYYDRKPWLLPEVLEPSLVAHWIAETITPGSFLAGCTVHFDAAFLNVFLRENGQCPMWNYHLIDCTTYAAGRMQLKPPWKSTTLFEAYGIETDESKVHTALYDAEMSQRLFWAAHDLAAA
jgi:DNA polymerase III epsilon subunit-like protein